MPFYLNIKLIAGLLAIILLIIFIIFFFAFFAIVILPFLLIIYLFRKKILDFYIHKGFKVEESYFMRKKYNNFKILDSNNWNAKSVKYLLETFPPNHQNIHNALEIQSLFSSKACKEKFLKSFNLN